ncbi:hypothetical protein AOL_s00176g60 [Orbilia oligospora ATCC 24927]|uniref:T6SS Phospholipase effector Tle1-like catalytic domain-containing protein n=1 Tax=Arthrobotrys oligospora (strain ATCC 24927 / CBS 115.81 / DSM 1491) TaxID=756982 RepID=G1XPT6_ARTOA|nr:hypothetical protein AOL_s00176g60 [Orbilia oligospora ATCC 24927]EGX44889.1 hypothetical protein AOL_s00176g60 [Orbilia oligospora ATCC 24927]
MSTISSAPGARAASTRIQLEDGSYAVQGSTYKRVIICCDGTWQGSDKGVETVPSNIARLVKAIAPKKLDGDGRETQQVVFYQSGIGSTSWGTVGNMAAGATGAGLDDNVLEAYYFLCNNVEPDDEIFLFGFSRGAYTARTLGGLIDEFDIIDRYSLHQFPEVYSAYKARNEKNSDEFKRMYDGISTVLLDNDVETLSQVLKTGKIVRYPAKIKVIGVFDTVGAMGIPESRVVRALNMNADQKFRDPRLSTKVENAFHALALDDHRIAFTPTMWHQPFEGRDINDPLMYKGPNLIQVWFPGMHVNVGGGNSDNKPVVIPRDNPNDGILTPHEFVKKNESWTSWMGSKISSGLSALNPFAIAPEKGSDGNTVYANGDDEELADITLMWMIDRCRPFLTFNEKYLDYLVEMHDKKLAVIRKEALARLSVSRVWPGQKDLKFGWACGPIVDSFQGATAMAGSQNRAPGQYTSDFTVGNIIDETRDHHHTREYMHPSVRWRYFENGDEYKRCRGLDGFKLADYTKPESRDSNPAKKDILSSGIIWEKKVPKPAPTSGPTLRVSEIRVEKDIVWQEVVGGKKVDVRADSLEYRLMGDKIFQALQKGQSFDTPIKAKGLLF